MRRGWERVGGELEEKGSRDTIKAVEGRVVVIIRLDELSDRLYPIAAVLWSRACCRSRGTVRVRS